MRFTDVAIVGGGLSGLYAAFLLQQQGVRCVVFEARARPGGRVLSVGVDSLRGGPADAADGPLQPDGGHPAASPPATPGPSPRYDLGATWFWPELQPQLAQLVQDLQLSAFAQPVAGHWLLERSRHHRPERVPGYTPSPPSMRLAGGMATLVEALAQPLGAECLLTGHTVQALTLQPGGVHLEVLGAGLTQTWHAQHVLLALPPRLAATALRFNPALPPALYRAWQHTPTWMAPHAKYLAVFDRPFWREAGLAGAAQSTVGPMGEVHDAGSPPAGPGGPNDHGGPAALFGFIGWPATARAQMGRAALMEACRAQLVRLFGPAAAQPQAEALHDWALEAHTATAQDQVAGGHATSPPASVAEGPWAGRLWGAGSEWSPEFPGYLAGAVEAAGRAVQALLRQPTGAIPGARRGGEDARPLADA